MSIGPISLTSRVRPEWEVIDLESGTCTTQVYFSPDEVNGKEIQSQVHAFMPNSTVNTIAPSTASRRPYWSHSLISLSPTNASAAMSNGYCRPALENPENDPRIRSKSTPSCLRGDAMAYVPRRAISLGGLPLTSVIPKIKVASRAYTSMLMTKDITMANSSINHSNEAALLHPPLVHISSLMDKSAVNFPSPRSPKPKFIPTFASVDENSTLNLNTEAFRRLLLSPEFSASVTKPKPANPFISFKRENGSVHVSLKYNTMPIYSVTVDLEGYSSENSVKKRQVTGPYRSAAMWEFVGQTFGKYDRYKKLKPKKRRVIRDCLERITPSSSLSNQILVDNDEDTNVFDNAEVRAEWTNFVNSTDILDRSPSRLASRPLRLPSQGFAREKSVSNNQSEDRRGRLRTRANLLDRYSMEKMSTSPRSSSRVLPHAVQGNPVQEETKVADRCEEGTRNTGKPS